MGRSHSCLSLTRVTQQGQPQVLAHGAEVRCVWEGHKEVVILPVLSVSQQQQPVIHEPYHVRTLPCQLRLKNHLKICMGFPKTGTPSSSEKEPMPQGSQESSQASLHHSQHPKKKKLDSAKRSSREGFFSKAHKKSKHHKEMPKKEKHHWWDKADKSKSAKSHKK